MKIKKIIHIILFLFLGNIYAQELEVKIELEKKSYITEEPIHLLINFKNLVDKDIIVNHLSLFNGSEGYSLVIKDKDNNIVRQRFFGNKIYDIRIIERNSTYIQVFSLFPFLYANTFDESPDGNSLGFIKSGFYSMILNFDIKIGGEIVQYKSNILEFEIVDQKNTKEIKKFEEYKKIRYQYRKSKVNFNTGLPNDVIGRMLSNIKKNLTLVEKKSSPGFAKLVYSDALRKLEFVDKPMQLNTIKKFITKYPNSFMSIWLVHKHDLLSDIEFNNAGINKEEIKTIFEPSDNKKILNKIMSQHTIKLDKKTIDQSRRSHD